MGELGGEVQSPAEAEPSHTTGRHTLLPVVWKATPEHEQWRLQFCTQTVQSCRTSKLKDFPRCGRPTTIKSGLTLLVAKRTRGKQRETTSENQRRVVSPNRNFEETRNYESIQQCSITNKCGYGEGHCDSDDECLLAFQCGSNN